MKEYQENTKENAKENIKENIKERMKRKWLKVWGETSGATGVSFLFFQFLEESLLSSCDPQKNPWLHQFLSHFIHVFPPSFDILWTLFLSFCFLFIDSANKGWRPQFDVSFLALSFFLFFLIFFTRDPDSLPWWFPLPPRDHENEREWERQRKGWKWELERKEELTTSDSSTFQLISRMRISLSFAMVYWWHFFFKKHPWDSHQREKGRKEERNLIFTLKAGRNCGAVKMEFRGDMLERRRNPKRKEKKWRLDFSKLFFHQTAASNQRAFQFSNEVGLSI